MAKKYMERRFKIVYVDEEVIAAFLFKENIKNGKVYLRSNDLPDDVELVGVDYAFPRMAFAFKIWHGSFDVVPIGMMIPAIDVIHRQHVIDLMPEQRKEFIELKSKGRRK